MLSFRLIKPWIVLTIALMSLTFYQVEAQQFVVKEAPLSMPARPGNQLRQSGTDSTQDRS